MAELVLNTKQVRAIHLEIERQNGHAIINGTGKHIERFTVKEFKADGWRGLIVAPIGGDIFSVGAEGEINEDGGE